MSAGFVIHTLPNGLALQGAGDNFNRAPQAGDSLSIAAASNEAWQIVQFRGVTTPDNTRAYQIYFVERGLVADIPAFSEQSGTVVQLWTPNGGKNQLWTLLPQSGLTANGHLTTMQLKFMSAFNGMVLNYPNETQGGSVTQVPNGQGGENLGQYWNLQSLNDSELLLALTKRSEVDGEITLSSDPLSAGEWGPNRTYSILFMNIAGVPLTQAWRDSLGGGHLGLPGAESIRSDNNGNLIPVTFGVPLAFAGTTRPAGAALVVLEDESGDIAAMTTVDSSLFV